MRLYELLNPSGMPPSPTSSAATAPMVNPTSAAPPPTAAVQPPMGQQANMLTDFFSTPHPTGAAPAVPPPPGQPSGLQNFINNNSFVGDVNRGLSGGQQPAPAEPTAAGPKPPGS